MTSTFTSADMILQKKNNKIMSGGYSINSLLMQKNLAPIALQGALQGALQTGGKGTNNKGTNKLDQLFDNLAVPAGLLFIQPPNKQINTTKNYSTTIGDAIPSKLYDKLLDIVDKKKRLHFGNKTIRARPKPGAGPGAKPGAKPGAGAKAKPGAGAKPKPGAGPGAKAKPGAKNRTRKAKK